MQSVCCLAAVLNINRRISNKFPTKIKVIVSFPSKLLSLSVSVPVNFRPSASCSQKRSLTNERNLDSFVFVYNLRYRIVCSFRMKYRYMYMESTSPSTANNCDKRGKVMTFWYMCGCARAWMFVCARVYVCVYTFWCVRVCVCLCVGVRACVRACVRKGTVLINKYIVFINLL